MRLLALTLAILPASLAHAQPALPATTLADLQHLRTLARQEPDAHKLTELTEGRYPTAYIHGRCMVGFLGREVQEGCATDAPAIMWGTRVGAVRSFRVDIHQLDRLNELACLDYAELAGKVKPHLDRVRSATRVDSVHRGIDLPQAYTGADVLIGITDWGFDYTSPMFYDTLLTQTRIRAAWDQFRQAGPAPEGYDYGAAFDTPEELLGAQADTANIYSYATHGSHVAGIAGGSGAGLNYRGMAFEAQYLFCTFLVDAAAVLDAFQWMKAVADADQKRLVVNMSWGLYHMGTLDGNSLISQAIDGLSEEGVVFVNSGGNNGDVNFHIKRTFTGDTIRSRIQIYPYSAHPRMWGQSISMWGEPGQDFSTGLIVTNNANNILQETPWYYSGTQEAYLDSFMVQGVDTVFFNLTADAAHPLNGRPHFRLRVKNRSSQLKVALKATAPDGIAHFWNVTELTNDVGNWGQTFTAAQNGWLNGDKNYGISEPACTESLITVAAYTGEFNGTGGGIATFSSYGPTLDERRKPDIAAPGVNVASSISSFTDNSYSSVGSVTFQGRSYPFARFSGTSMSSPAVAGIAALVLQADPSLTSAEVKDILMSTAREDAYTGVIPEEGSVRWGQGKVNAYRAVRQALGITEVVEVQNDELMLWPNPAQDELNVLLLAPINNTIVELWDATGRRVMAHATSGSAQLVFDVAGLGPGVYTVRMGGVQRALRVVKY
ncbi:MAG: S8 family peptidase [Flavobacteriales bacterium]|nr:S8 family peptidase [Flavobacteriales bacterium]